MTDAEVQRTQKMGMLISCAGVFVVTKRGTRWYEYAEGCATSLVSTTWFLGYESVVVRYLAATTSKVLGISGQEETTSRGG